MDIRNSKNWIESQKCRLENNHSRKEIIRMMKCIIERKNKEEENKRMSRERFKDKDRRTIMIKVMRRIIMVEIVIVIKILLIIIAMMRTYGMRYFLNKSRCLTNQLLRKLIQMHRLILFIILIKCRKIQVSLTIMVKVDSIKNLGWKILKNLRIRRIKTNKRKHSLNHAILMGMDQTQTLLKHYKDKLLS